MTTADVLQAALDLGYVYWLEETRPVLQHPGLPRPRPRPGQTTAEIRRARGECPRCGVVAAPGKSMCPAHLQEARDRYYARKHRKDR